MAEFKLNSFRYTWKGNWVTGTAYKRDDIVRYGSKSYVCIRTHTADADFYTDLYYTFPGETNQSPAWVVMVSGTAFRGNWALGQKYNLGDVVLYGGVLYLCVDDFTSSVNFDNDIANWTVFADSLNFRNEWQPSTRYGIGDLVRYGGNVYKCITGHTSGIASQGLEQNSSDWELFYSGEAGYVGEYTSGTRYKPDELVKYGGSILRVIVGHTAGITINNNNFTTEIRGFNFYQEWSSSVYYADGDVVKFGGNVYRALANNYNANPGDSIYQPAGSPTWELISKGINIRGDWSSTETYNTGDVVRRGGYLFVAKINNVSADGSSLDYLDDSNWEIVVPGQNWRGDWAEDTTYGLGDLINFEGNLYTCTVQHLASSNPPNWPGDNGEGINYWDLTLLASTVTGMRKRGDLLTYGLKRSELGDQSTLGPTRVPIGDPTKLLSINADGDLYYRDWGAVQRVFHVDPAGVDDETNPLAGIDPNLPFRTIRFAAEKADDGFAGTTTISVSTGLYEEILPIIVPARTVILGDELRSTVIQAAGPIAALANDSSYTKDILNRFKAIIPSIIQGLAIAVTPGNTGSQIFPDAGEEGSAGASSTAVNLLQDIVNYIDYYIDSGPTNPTLSGSNTENIDPGFAKARAIIEDNIEFFEDEAVAFMNYYYPTYNFVESRCRRDVRRYMSAVLYDMRYSGNYKSLFAARYYRNAVLGSLTEDMFYLRDSTGVRDCTLKGLEGTLNPPNVFDLYRRPTGGSFCSLDPGWGPEDDRTWITTRSPYIQGVTTFGYAAIGQKIDGALHNGGNRSMVSNDFTQVISDGIGAWVLNNGRAELVSVFTYYSTVGYLAETGGRIRATNGNNSYGRYGAIADGVDPNEIPRTGIAFNRNQEASVANAGAFAGEVNDEILLLEFSNAGQNYTTADYSFVGSGVGANVVQDDIRDNAVFQTRVIDPEDSTGFGGGGYILIGNNAQVSASPATDQTGITIASNDQNAEANYLGMRIIITSGNGTGQYGRITGYNTTSKIVTVARESDGQPGWDHVLPGYPNVTFTTSTTYRIEARPTFSAPPFVVSEETFPVQISWSAVAYGEKTTSFTNITGSPGTNGETLVTPITAIWNVSNIGRAYSVTLVNPGAGYNQDDIIIISGNDVGGLTPDNDITIKVTEVSDDSTNSILSFTYTGRGASGNFVVTPTTGQVGVYSLDGTTWEIMTLPSAGDWKCVATGLNKFVAIRNNSNQAASSLDGITWTARTMPASRLWNAVAYGNGIFVAVAGNLDAAARSTNGETWTSFTLPDSDDSTFNEWVDITYGKNMFVAIANSNNMVATGHVDPDTKVITWDTHIMDVFADSSQKNWVSIAYGNNRFVAMTSQGDAAYSFDGTNWYSAEMPKPDGSTRMNWKQMKYGNGIFYAVCDTGNAVIGNDPTTGPTTYSASSEDGIVWTGRVLASEKSWKLINYGNPQLALQDSTLLGTGKNTPTWIAVSDDVTDIVNKIHVGAVAKGRIIVDTGRINAFKMWDVGSGYNEDPTITLTDPNATSFPVFDTRVADGVLGQPSWLNRGVGYKTSTTDVFITGDGFADEIPSGRFITLSGLSTYPRQGSQLIFDGNSQIYTCAIITPITITKGGSTTGLAAYIRIQPEFDTVTGPAHETDVIIRERFSQCRITGHDFLDIGTGNFEETNYPEIYSTGLYTPAPENEVYEENGGRVFYTSTDQSGNFRAGELFSVEQATGIVTISADYFDLGGLSELRLGGVRLGGSGVIIREFSTDALFSEDSNNVVPTQRAIKAYLANRLSVGGSEIATASFIAGTVRVGPERIASTTNGKVVIPVQANFEGPLVHISGSILAQAMFAKSFKSVR